MIPLYVNITETKDEADEIRKRLVKKIEEYIWFRCTITQITFTVGG